MVLQKTDYHGRTVGFVKYDGLSMLNLVTIVFGSTTSMSSVEFLTFKCYLICYPDMGNLSLQVLANLEYSNEHIYIGSTTKKTNEIVCLTLTCPLYAHC